MSSARTLRFLLVICLVVSAAMTQTPLARAAPWDSSRAAMERVGTDDPAATAVAVSQRRFSDEAAEHVVLSRDDDFADSLAGAPLTAGGPLLYSRTSELAAPTRDEIQRVLQDGGVVFLLGGTAAIGVGVEDGLRQGGFDVRRLSGTSRFETAVAVADEVRRLHPGTTDVALARATAPHDAPTAAWADSITGGAWAAAQGVPMLLTDSAELHPAAAQALARYAPSRTVLLGGEVALSAAVEATAPAPHRIAGAERAGTAAAVATELWGPSGRYLLFNAYQPDGWAYGLAAAGIAADEGAPLLVSGAANVPEPTLELVQPCGGIAAPVIVIGGGGTISPEVEASLARDGRPCQDPAVDRLPLPPGHRVLQRLVGRFVSPNPTDVFVVSDGPAMDDAVMSVMVPDGGSYRVVAQQAATADLLAGLQVDALGHVVALFYVGAHSMIGFAWGFEDGVPRMYPGPEGFFSNGLIEAVDVNGDGILELAVQLNDCDPSCAGGTTVTDTYGWTGAGYEVVATDRPPADEAATCPAQRTGRMSYGQAALCFYETYKAGDAGRARAYATQQVVDTLFQYSWYTEWQYDGCGVPSLGPSSSTGTACFFYEPGEPHGVAIEFGMGEDPSTGAYIESVEFAG